MHRTTQLDQESITCPKCASEDVTFSKKKQLYVCPDCHHEFTIEKSIPKRRIFLSYGHDQYASLAEQLKSDLQDRGHEVWFDLDRLKSGGDWEAYIAEGLEWVSKTLKEGRFILLMTPHSVRRPDGYCLNEITRALERQLTVIPLMVVQSEPPFSICRTQWLDMRDCVPVQERMEKYETKFVRLLEALEDDRIDFEGVQMRLIQRLSPLPFEADILPHLARFTGRQWVFDRIDAWLADTKVSRVFWITGKPGVGKTAIAAWLCTNRGEIAAFHLCRHGHVEKSNPTRAILSIAYQLSSQLPDYQERLNKLDLEKIITVESPRTIFDILIVQPLTIIPRPGRKYVVLIDALDEATVGGKNELASFIGSEFDRTPDWLRLIITSRHEPEVENPLQGLTPYELDASTPENEEDIRAFLKRELKTFTGGIEVEQHVIKTIFEKSEGIFLYVEWIRRELVDKRLSLDKLDKFPLGLGGIYVQFFNRKFPNIDKFQINYLPVLELIAAAREPLEVEHLASFFSWSIYENKNILDAFGSLFPVSNNRIQPFHKSVIDWLIDEKKAGNYFIDVEEGHKRLADQGWKEYQGGAGKLSRYSVVHLPAHLSLLGRKDELRRLLFDFGWIHAKLEATDINSLIKDYDYISDDRTLRLVQGALRLSAHFLARDKTQLPSQLIGRMLSFQEPEIKSLLEGAHEWKDGIWLRPLTASLTPPGGPLIRTLKGHTLQVYGVAMHPDGKRAISASWDNTLKIWDLESGEVLNSLRGHDSIVFAVAVFHDGKRAISGSYDIKPLKIWDLETGEVLNTLEGHTGVVFSVVMLPNGKQAISASSDGTLIIWDLESGKVLNTLEGHTAAVKAVAVFSDGKRAISASSDETLKIWDLESGKVLNTLEGHTSAVNAVAVFPDGKRAISASSDGTLKIWDIESGKILNILKGHTGAVNAVAVLPDGKRAISASSDRTLKIWDIESGKILNTLKGHTGFVYAVAVLPDGKRAISASSDYTLKIWDIESVQGQNTHEEQTNSFYAVTFLPKSKYAILAPSESSFKILDIERWQVLNTLESPANSVYAVAVHPDGKRAISASSDGLFKIWDIEIGQVLNIFKEHNDSVYAVTVLPDGIRAISASHDETIRVWNIENGVVLNTLKGHTGFVNSVAVLPDGNRAISASHDKTLRVWDLKSGEVLKILEGHTESVWSVAVLSDGKRAISASQDKTLKVWDIESGEVLNTLEGHTSFVKSVAVFPDGKRAISASWDNTLKIWDLESGEVLNTLYGHTAPVYAVAVFRDGKRAISASEDNTLKVWDMESGNVLADFGGDSPLNDCAVSPDGNTILVGGGSGVVHILRLEGAD